MVRFGRLFNSLVKLTTTEAPKFGITRTLWENCAYMSIILEEGIMFHKKSQNTPSSGVFYSKSGQCYIFLAGVFWSISSHIRPQYIQINRKSYTSS